MIIIQSWRPIQAGEDMMIRAIGFLLFLAPASQEGQPSLAATVDKGVRAVAGFNPTLPMRSVDDATFLRRLTKDLISEDPGAAEIKKFEADADASKRLKKIDELLASKQFAQAWALRFEREFFGDRKKVKMEIPGLAPGSEEVIVGRFTEWLEGQIAKDKPWTEIVASILDARGAVAGDPALGYKLSFERGPQPAVDFAVGFSRHFLGVRIRCARCHDHPFDLWKVEDVYGLAAFNVRQRVRLVKGAVEVRYSDEGELSIEKSPDVNDKDNKVKLAAGGTAKPKFLYGGEAGPNDDRIKVLGNLVTGKANPQLPRALANRVWFWLFGHGIVDPPDDFNLRNKASSQALLEDLTKHLIANNYSIKSLVRGICASQIYQAEEVPPVREGATPLYRGRTVKGPFIPKKLPTGWVSFEVPEGWSRVERRYDMPYRWRVPDKEKTALTADFGIQEGGSAAAAKIGQVEGWRGQMFGGEVASEKIEGGKHPITLFSITGAFYCDPDLEGLPPYRFLVGVVETQSKSFLFRLSGPPETVGDWRDEFVKLLKAASIP